jgi:RNA polymerase primary sigma factor
MVTVTSSWRRGKDATLESLGVYENQIRSTPLLTAAEEVQLAIAIRSHGPEASTAWTRFVTANQRLVWKIARRYQGQGLELEDLIASGNVGLVQAIQRFDPARGNKFSTMAIWWIRQAITRAIEDTGRPIRLPSYLHKAVTMMRKEEARLLEELGRIPTNEELETATGLPLSQIAVIRQMLNCPRSLSETLGDDDLILSDTIADEEPLEENVTENVFSEELDQVLQAILTPREYFVVQHRFGLGSSHEESLEQVGRVLGITRERVRQIEAGAIAKLRHSPHFQAFCANLRDT